MTRNRFVRAILNLCACERRTAQRDARHRSRRITRHDRAVRIETPSRQPRGDTGCGRLHAVRHLRRDECVRAQAHVGRDGKYPGAIPTRDRGRSAGPVEAGERRSDRRAAVDRHDPYERHRDRSVHRADARRLEEGSLSTPGRMAPSHVRPRRRDLLGLLGNFLVRRDGAVRRQGCHGALWLRARVLGRVSSRGDSSGARARDFRSPRRAGELGCVDDVA